jgi:hypothetical protein
VRSLDVPIPHTFPPEWGGGMTGPGRDDEPMSRDDHAAVAQCMKLSAEAWFALHLWGRRSGALAEWEAGVAHTLSSYAGGGWQKVPSAKQAIHGVRILELASEHGFDPFAHGSLSLEFGNEAVSLEPPRTV